MYRVSNTLADCYRNCNILCSIVLLVFTNFGDLLHPILMVILPTTHQFWLCLIMSAELMKRKFVRTSSVRLWHYV